MDTNPTTLHEVGALKLGKKVDFYENRVQKWLRWHFEVTIVHRNIAWQG